MASPWLDCVDILTNPSTCAGVAAMLDTSEESHWSDRRRDPKDWAPDCTLTTEPGHRSQDVGLGHRRHASPGVYQQGSYGLGRTESGFINKNMGTL